MFTSKEDKEFTNLNAAAFDLARTKAKVSGEKVPLWLCMSDGAKEEARNNFMNWCRGAMGMWVTDAHILSVVNNTNLVPMIANWRKLEGIMKAERDSGNPGAYFI